MSLAKCLVRGDCVRVMDRAPTSYVLSADEHEQSYIVGIISGVDMVAQDQTPHRAYLVNCFYDSDWRFVEGKLESRVGQQLTVPMRIESDFAKRITKI